MSKDSQPSPKKRLRADELLVLKGLADTRSKAKLLILAGKVYLPHARIEKASSLLPIDSEIRLTEIYPYVSRGAEKLKGFFEKFPHSLTDCTALDVGASTGGFTDYLLQNGVSHVSCVDVGRGQLHMRLRNDPRVYNLEQANARHLESFALPHLFYDFVVMDLSFISLTKILPEAWKRVKEKGLLIALIKPQFEAEKREVDRAKGIIKDPAIRERIVLKIQSFINAELKGSQILGTLPSPIAGGDGNQEYLIGIQKLNWGNNASGL